MQAEVAATGLGFPEGPVVLPDGRVAVCEEYAGRISVFDGTALAPVADTGGSPNGATLGSDGHLYVAQNGGVVGAWRSEQPIQPGIQRVALDGTVERILTEVAGIALEAPNDICFGPDGRLYFTDPAYAYDPGDTQDGRIFAVGGNGGEVFHAPGRVYNNGLGFLPDGRLCWVESYTRNVMVLEDGVGRKLCTLPDGHIPDGFAVASDGRIFVATYISHGIDVVSPGGEHLDHLLLDERATCTNCAFQGSVLWVTDVGEDGKLDGGRLWRVETDAAGLPMHAGAL